MQPAYNFAGEPSIDGPAPAGYRVTVRSRVIGRGEDAFAAAVRSIRAWGIQRGSGFRAVDVPSMVESDAVSVWAIPFGPLRPRVPCRVFEVVDEPRRAGFGHGALVGHPQRGWESFIVTLSDSGEVTLRIRVVWRPAARWMRLAGPFVGVALGILLRRNLRALTF